MWIARDEDKSLWLFIDKPKRNTYTWTCESQAVECKLPMCLFPNLTWEDEPIEVRLVTDNDLKDVVDLTLQYTHLPLRDQIDISTEMYVHDYYLQHQ